MKKVLRDGSIFAGPSAGVVLILTEQYGWAEGPAMVVGMAAAAVVAFGYRVIHSQAVAVADGVRPAGDDELATPAGHHKRVPGLGAHLTPASNEGIKRLRCREGI